jgi:hypothetical protein
MTAFEIVPFHDTKLEAVREGDDVWVSLRRMCEGIGIELEAQRRKLAEKPWAVTGLRPATGPDGKKYEVLCLHLDSVPMWLATIDVRRVAAEARPTVERFQLECARVLRDHFFPHRASQPAPFEPSKMTSAAFRQIADLMDTTTAISAEVTTMHFAQQRLEQRVAYLERHPPTKDRLDAIRKAFEVDVRGNVFQKYGPDPDGTHNSNTNRFLKIRLGKKRKTWVERDYLVAVEVAETELGFRMATARKLMPELRPSA